MPVARLFVPAMRLNTAKKTQIISKLLTDQVRGNRDAPFNGMRLPVMSKRGAPSPPERTSLQQYCLRVSRHPEDLLSRKFSAQRSPDGVGMSRLIVTQPAQPLWKNSSSESDTGTTMIVRA
jgi:hypothetical protein